MLRKLKIGTRAAASFALLALLVILLGTVTLIQMKRMDAASNAIEAKWFTSMLALEEMGMSAARIRALTLRTHIIRETKQRSADLATLEQSKREFDHAEQEYIALIGSAEERSTYERFRSSREHYMAT